VQPATAHTLLASGQPQVEAAADGLALGVRFSGYEPEWLVFEVEYHNEGSVPVTIDPSSFASVPLRAEVVPHGRRVKRGEQASAAAAAASLHAPWPELPPAPLPALDPAAGISQLKADSTQVAASPTYPKVLAVGLFTVALWTDIANSGKDDTSGTSGKGLNYKEMRGREARRNTRQAVHELTWAVYHGINSDTRAHHASIIHTLAQRAGQLRKFALQRVQLQPGQQVRGYVYLPRFDAADGMQVLAPLGREPVALNFVQTHQRR